MKKDPLVHIDDIYDSIAKSIPDLERQIRKILE